MKIEHIAMYVKDLKAARDFFVAYLGGKPNDGYHNPRTGFRSFFISFDDGARLELMNKPEMYSAAWRFGRSRRQRSMNIRKTYFISYRAMKQLMMNCFLQRHSESWMRP